MKLSTVFVLTATAFTGSADAVKINIGNLRASALQKNTEVFEDEDNSLQSSDDQDTLETCAAQCKPSSKDAATFSEEEIAASMTACINQCYDIASNNDPAARAALSDEKGCAVSCTEKAARKFEEVSKQCEKSKSSYCKRGKECDQTCEDDDKKCEKEVEECEVEFEECEECAEEVEEAEKSVRKVGKEFEKCFVDDCVPESTESNLRASALQKNTEVFEDEDNSLQSSDDQDTLETCAAQCKPSSRDAATFSEEEIAASMTACINQCYDTASNNDPATRAALSDEKGCAVSCTEKAARKFEEVSKQCEKSKSSYCKRGKECDQTCEDDDKKCEKEVEECEVEFEECEECAEEVEEAEKSVKKVGKEFEKCFVDDCVTNHAVEIAQQ